MSIGEGAMDKLRGKGNENYDWKTVVISLKEKDTYNNPRFELEGSGELTMALGDGYEVAATFLDNYKPYNSSEKEKTRKARWFLLRKHKSTAGIGP